MPVPQVPTVSESYNKGATYGSLEEEHNDSYSVCSSLDSNDSDNTVIKKLEK